MRIDTYSRVGILLLVFFGVGIATKPSLGYQPFGGKLLPQGSLEKGLRQALETAFVPPKDSAPSATATSATRDPQRCQAKEPRFHAVVPPGGYGLTLKRRPVITLELSKTSAKRVAFVVQDESGKLHGSAFLPLSQSSEQPLSEAVRPSAGASQWVGFQLPDSIPPLEANQPYRWSLVVVCGESLQPDDPTFMGWVEYRETTLDIDRALRTDSQDERAEWLAQNGYWYDLVDEVSQ